MEEILDDNFRNSIFKTPIRCQVDQEKWLVLCSKLQRRSLLWFAIIIAIAIYIFYHLFPIFIVIIILMATFSILKMNKKFSRLRELKKHYFIIDQNKIIYNNNHFSNTYYLNNLKNFTLLEWGIELEFKPKTSQDVHLTIPKMLENYDNLASLLKQTRLN